MLVFDNETQFKSKKILKFCEKIGIQQSFSNVSHSQINGQAKVLKKVILKGLKKRLEDAKGRWVKELPLLVRVFKTTSRRSTGVTPFSLAYDT